jgi:hypothetical protein
MAAAIVPMILGVTAGLLGNVVKGAASGSDPYESPMGLLGPLLGGATAGIGSALGPGASLATQFGTQSASAAPSLGGFAGQLAADQLPGMLAEQAFSSLPGVAGGMGTEAAGSLIGGGLGSQAMSSVPSIASPGIEAFGSSSTPGFTGGGFAEKLASSAPMPSLPGPNPIEYPVNNMGSAGSGGGSGAISTRDQLLNDYLAKAIKGPSTGDLLKQAALGKMVPNMANTLAGALLRKDPPGEPRYTSTGPKNQFIQQARQRRSQRINSLRKQKA